MINKTFNSDSTDGRALEVGRNGERPWLNIREFDLENTMFMLAPSDAPALALAILEAAGYEERQKGWDVLNSADENFAQAMRCLSGGLELQERITAEAKAQAELEAEALELFKTFMGVKGYENFTWSEVVSKDEWLAVARKAREMGAKK